MDFTKYIRESFFTDKKTKKCIFLLVLFLFAGLEMYQYFGHKKQDGFPIDLVYTWVDGNDEEWAAKKSYWQQKTGADNPYAVHQARSRDREELKHSLRSVEKYMPWVNKIYIVTDNQVPEWLNTNHPKIKIVDHKEILPLNALPVFNSMAIETGIANIKGLSEHFIYANDDMFVGKPLPQEFFFTPDGTPIFYKDEKFGMFLKALYEKEKKEGTMWAHLIDNIKKTNEKYGINMELFDFADNHTFSSYLKSEYLQAMSFFAEEINKTAYSKFRSEDDLDRTIVFDYSWAFGNVMVVDSKNVKQYGCKKSGILVMTHVEDLEKYDPCTFCLNDTHNMPEDKLDLHTNIMRKMFPEKSSFEK